ncbi:unnamed protein product [Acanthoscelides obtectus]|uniref:Acidic leucine-rich nuclear phosphoprotein 32 family member A n=1 Tax=Acanthoscelides obtectus TaxID=200917 RepID=A0A9P0P5A9_ACAOB|nr:unnamed protein product [Acanthoscelides obtectus]CAK1672686.1 Acidic leucine-rich nuclear phosphoprotein 32 family member A [Acanthoscelides obtectus]
MEKRIELEKRGKNPADIVELNLDNCRSTSIVGLTDEFVNLESLSLINVGLVSLKGFPKLPNLKKLDLGENRITNGLNLLETSPKLTYLNLSGNKIKDLATLEPLKNFKNLKNLDLFNNEATMIDNYREKVFKLIPSLKYLDGFDEDDGEADTDGEEEEVNGNEDDSEAEDEEEDGGDEEDDEEAEVEGEESSSAEDEDEEEEEDTSVGLGAVYSENLDELSDEDDYVAGDNDEEDEEEDGVDDEEEEEAGGAQQQAKQPTTQDVSRGKKRKLEDGGEGEN